MTTPRPYLHIYLLGLLWAVAYLIYWIFLS